MQLQASETDISQKRITIHMPEVSLDFEQIVVELVCPNGKVRTITFGRYGYGPTR